MNEIEATGKTVQDAVDSALQELNTTIEKVNINILCEGGMFKKAKVKVKMIEEKPLSEQLLDSLKNDEFLEENDKDSKIEKDSEVKENLLSEDTPLSNEYQTYVANFLKRTLNEYREGIEVLEREQNKVFVLQIKGKGTEKLGKTEVINALQTLLNGIERHHNRENNKRIIVNVGDYEERRKEALCNEALKCADQAMSEGRTIRMQPMNSYERHLIHDYLQERQDVVAESFGVEPYRYLTIRPKDKE